MFDARAKVRDDARSERRSVQQFGIDTVGDRRHQRIEFTQGARQRIAIERHVVRIGRDVVTVAQTFVHRFGQAARDQEAGTLHGTPGADARMDRSISPMARHAGERHADANFVREHLEHLRNAALAAGRQRECPGTS